jgi:hypothetical protein
MPDGTNKRLVGFLPGGEALTKRPGFPLIPSEQITLPEFRRLLYAVEALRSDQRNPVLQFLGVEGGEGVSGVASGFALAASREAELPVLYVNCAPGPATDRTDGVGCVRGQVVQLPAANLRWMDLSVDALALAGPDGGGLRHEIETSRAYYAALVLDCTGGATPANLGLARFCDGTVLVVQAEATPIGATRAARAAVQRVGGQVVGAVMTHTRQRLPRWIARLL